MPLQLFCHSWAIDALPALILIVWDGELLVRVSGVNVLVNYKKINYSVIYDYLSKSLPSQILC